MTAAGRYRSLLDWAKYTLLRYPRHPIAIPVEQAQSELGPRVLLFRRLAIPVNRLGVIFCTPPANALHPEVVLRFR